MMKVNNRQENNRSRAAEYFGRPAFRRMLQAVWRKYTSLGRIGGRAVVQRLTDEECEAINSFFGWNKRPEDTLSIPLPLFEQELLDSAFAVGIVELHEILEGKPLLTRSDRLMQEDAEWRSLINHVRHDANNISKYADSWLSQVGESRGAGWRTVRELYKTDRQQTIETLRIIIEVLNLLFAEHGVDNGGISVGDNERSNNSDQSVVLSDKIEGGDGRHVKQGVSGLSIQIRLPVLAAQVSGDAHALDQDRPAGRILLAVLLDERAVLDGGVSGQTDSFEGGIDVDEVNSNSETLIMRDLYRRFGILDDDLSSIVHWYLPNGSSPRLPKVWTLREVEAVESIPRCSSIFVVENPAVFSTILDMMPSSADLHRDSPILICTSGPASAAAIRWIQRCIGATDHPCKLYYSGDFDLKGLTMGMTLARLFPDHFVSWRFDSVAYTEAARNLPGPALDSLEVERLRNMTVIWDDDLCRQMCETGYKVHQEVLVEQLARDYLSDDGG